MSFMKMTNRQIWSACGREKNASHCALSSPIMIWL
jgi:hypothetical protein